jgi:LmbE family N-acetylglucosaminyl deacetylase
MTLALDPGVPCLFVSPHLDDAILSCGALIARLARTNPVVVTTIFTSCSAPPHTLSGRTFLRQCAQPDAACLFAERRREDVAVLARAGARHVHLGFTDALFRIRDRPGNGRPRGRRGRRHVYPTHRLHVGRGRVSSHDLPVIDQVRTAVDAVAKDTGTGYAFFPLAVGRHVDHVITRSIGAHYAGPRIFYADFPYLLSHRPDPVFLADHHLSEEPWTDGLDEKQGLVSGYRTQVPALFPDGAIPAVPERFYVPHPQPHRRAREHAAGRTGGVG